MAVQWYSVDDEDAQQRLVAAWEDAPIENLETLEYLLTTAREQVIAYAPIPAEATTPVTLEWPDGSTVALTRDSNLVTAIVTPANPNTLPFGAQDLPAGFAPVGNAYYFGYASLPTAGPGRYIVQIIEDGESAVVAGFVATGDPPPYAPFTAQWAADPKTGEDPPARYALAQLNLTRDLWNAGRTDASGSTGAEGFFYKPLSLSKETMRIIRPVDGRPHVL